MFEIVQTSTVNKLMLANSGGHDQCPDSAVLSALSPQLLPRNLIPDYSVIRQEVVVCTSNPSVGVAASMLHAPLAAAHSAAASSGRS